MNTQDLSALGAGFSDQAFGSQAVFRSALHALAHPGQRVAVEHDAQAPTDGHAASVALLLALLDPDCRLWLSSSLANSDVANWLRFHTGCTLVKERASAQFAWIAVGDELPALADLAQGDDYYPDQSCTCVIDVWTMSNNKPSAQSWTLTGPGIRNETALRVDGAPARFVPQWHENHARFPRGIDVFFATTEHIVGLPRTTQITTAPTDVSGH
jgi:alpha-D-ribose 1-methylphosphonate 5-triphosphate synthase subunit PhnH